MEPKTNDDRSMLKKIIGWEGVSFVAFLAIAFGLVSLPHQYDKARIAFMLSGIALALKLAVEVRGGLYPRFLVALLVAVLAGISINRVNDWVTSLEIEESTKESTNEIKTLEAKTRLKEKPNLQSPPVLVKPDLAFVLVDPIAPGLILWPLHSNAFNVKADPLLWDIDREDGNTDSLLVNEAKYDWIRPDQHGGPTALLHPNDVRNTVKPGHRIIGYITIGCPDCEHVRICWVYFIYGKNGWFMDVSRHGGPNPARLAESIPTLRNGDPEQFLSSFPEWRGRSPILPKP
jgi:hypothetical protein